MKEDPRRIGGLLYDLTFANVTIKDAKVIQCNISNKHGYNYTNAYINVYSKYCSVFSLIVIVFHVLTSTGCFKKVAPFLKLF